MKFFDLIRLIIGNLNRRKARVALTAIGVVIGTSAVVILVSLAIGLQQNATDQLYGIGDLTQIQVNPSYGEWNENQPPSFVPITDQSIADMAAIAGVQAVIPRDYLYGSAVLKFGRTESWTSFIGVGTSDLANLGLSAARGTTQLTKGTMVVGALVADNFYDPKLRPGQEPPAPPDLYDQKINILLIKYDSEGREIRKTVTVRVVGVLAATQGESDWSVYLQLDDMNTYNEWLMGKRINRNKDGYNQVTVKVDDVKNVLSIADTITKMGYQA
jgi:putative ABC transport system permease protein